MSGMSDAILPYYEELEGEFEEEYGRLPTKDEACELWECAEERMIDAAISRAEAYYEGDR